MPARPPTPCRHAGCRALVSPPGYCVEHKQDGAKWKPRASAAARGYDYAWSVLRLRILERDRWLCQCDECKATGRVLPAHEVDHHVPKYRGGTDDPANLRAINRDCHKRKSRREAAEARYGRRK